MSGRADYVHNAYLEEPIVIYLPPVCPWCEDVIHRTEKRVRVKNRTYHSDCYAKMLHEQGEDE